MTAKLLVLSSVLPTESGGGELVLRRHLLGLDPARWSVHLASTGTGREVPGDWPIHQLARFPLPERLRRTRFAPRLNDLIYSGALISKRAILRLVNRIRPDVLLTIAHGELAPLASWLAVKTDIPLVTLFHDWWPDIAGCSPRGQQNIERLFYDLYRVSYSSLCVCDGMAAEMPWRSDAQVLYPIPGPREQSDTNRYIECISDFRLRVAYSGTLAGSYGEMIAELARESHRNPRIDFKFCGPDHGDPIWSTIAGYEGCLSSDKCRHFLRRHDVLLVAMSFRAEDERRARTSFPSKLLEYCQVGLPLLVWGPSYCSAASWATARGAAEVVNDRSPAAVVETLNRLKGVPGRLLDLGRRASEAAAGEFDPRRIQDEFESALMRAIGSR